MLERASSVEAARTASLPLLQTSFAAKAAKSPAFANLFRVWCERLDAERLDDRAVLLALLWRLTALSSMSSHRRFLEKKIAAGLSALDRPLISLQDAKDRRAVGEALGFVKEAWAIDYLAAAIVNDVDPKSDARDVCCYSLMQKCSDLRVFFQSLLEALNGLVVEQADPAVGRARRLTWILRSIRPLVLSNEEIGANIDFGKVYSSFLAHGFGNTRTMDRKTTIEAVNEALGCLNSIVRLHGITLAGQASTYTAIEILKLRFSGTDWPSELAEPIRLLSMRVIEALLALARQGIADLPLRNVYVLLLGEVTASLKLRHLANSISDLSPEISFWLQKGRSRQGIESADAIAETSVSAIDLDLALALREVVRGQRLVPETRFEHHLRRLAGHLQEAARKRGLVIKGSIGEEVDLVPAEHEVTSIVMGARRVIIISPAVERVIRGKSAGIVLKAEVDLIKG